MSKIYPEVIETWDDVYQRTLVAKDFIRSYLKENELEKGKKVAIVGHGGNIRKFTIGKNNPKGRFIKNA